MITVAVANQKGGCGKTTSSVNLSAALTRQGARVLLIDLDAQAGATMWLTDGYGPKGRVIRDVLLRTRPLAETVLATGAGIDLVPSALTLSALDLELALKPNADGRLAAGLESVANRYDYVLIDCPPSLGIATLNAFTAADVIVIPIDCKAESLEAVGQLSEYVFQVADAYNRPIGVWGLPTFLERRITLSREIYQGIEEKFEDATLSPIHKNTKIAEAYLARQTIFDYDQTATGAMDYHRVAQELSDALTPRTDQAKRRRSGR